ncbi:MAG TPA: hypothetical protein EYH38_01285 [Leucothrix sp.]|nr:hypothetical protein [Leucothrix sp.]
MSNLNNKKIKICILEMSSQNKAILEFFFDNSGKSLFEETSLDKASAYIIDYDFPDAKESAENVHNTSTIPGIIISIKEVNLPDTVWIPKPLTIKALTDANEKISDIISASSENEESASALITPPLNNTQVKNQKTTPVEEVLALDSSVIEKNLHGDLKNIQTPETVTAESIQAKKGNIQNSQTIGTTTPVFAGLEDSLGFIEADSENKLAKQNKLEIDQQIIHETEQEVIETPSANTSDEIDDLLNQLITSGVNNDVNNDNDIEINDSSKLETPDEKTKNNTDAELTSLHFNNEVVEESKGILDQVNDQLNIDTFPDIDSENHLGLDFPEKSNANINIELDNTITESENIDNNDSNDDAEQYDDTSTSSLESLDDQIAALANMETPSSTDSTDKNYVENVIDDAITDLPIDEGYDVEPDLSNDADQAIDNDDYIEEIVAPEELQPAPNKIKENLSAEEELQSLLEEIRHEAEAKNSTIIYTKNGEKIESHRHTPTFAEERWALTCGESNPITNKPSVYNPDDYMLSTLLKVIKQSKSTEKVMRLKFNNIIVVVLPDLQTIYCDTSIYKKPYANICFNPINHESIKIHYLDSSEIRLYRKIINEEVEFSHTFEAFIWTTSLLTSRGRLPQGTNIKKTIALKYWPDLTRIETIPHVMQIAAVFYKHPGCLRDMPDWLGIERRYIFAFYNAALSLKLIELDHKQLSLVARKSNTLKKTQNRGFFSRLLKRINS